MWLPTLLAPELPAIVPAPVGGEFAEDAQRSLEPITRQPVSTAGTLPQTGLARLEAVGLYPPANKLGLENPRTYFSFIYFYPFDRSWLFYV